MNCVYLIGRVGKTPEVRTFDDGGKIARITLATTERAYKLKNGTEVPEHTDWHNLVIKGALAGIAEKYVNVGDKLAVNGKVSYREYEKDGKKFHATDILVNDFEMLSPKKGDGNSKTHGAAASESDDNIPF